MLSLFTALIPGLFKIGDKLIEDKDQKAEYAFKVQEMAFKQMETLLSVTTYPWVDALVKLSYAAEQIIKGLFRPIITSVALGFGIFFELNDIAVSPVVEGILFGSFPAWGVSRHMDKKKPKDEWD